MVQDIRSGCTPAALRPWNRLGTPGSTNGSTTATAASASRDVDASLSITTKDGDTFTISADFATTATYASSRAPGQRANAWSVSSTRQVSVSASGDFSAQEMQDISRVVRTFLHDLRAMLKGRDVSIGNVGAGERPTLQSVSATATATSTITAVAGVAHAAPAEPDTQPIPVATAPALA